MSPPEHLIGRRVAPIFLCNYVATAQRDRLDPELAGSRARWLGSSSNKVLDELVASSSYSHLPIWGAFESMEVMIEAAHAGLGLLMLPTYACDPDPRLERLAKPDLRHVGDFWLLSHGDLRDNARLRAAREQITAAMVAAEALFRGDVTSWRENAPVRPEVTPSGGGVRP